MKLMLLACEIIYREACYCISRTKNIVDAKFLPKGLHDIGCDTMSKSLQEEIDAISRDEYEAILLGYALCNNGIRGLRSEIPLIVPKAHDCITLLMGSKEKYREYTVKHPGTYFRSTGWSERNTAEKDENGRTKSVMTQLGLNRTFEEYAEKYGEENAKYIFEFTEGWKKNYDTLSYIEIKELGIFQEYEDSAKQEAEEKGWRFKKLEGDIRLIQNLVNGLWNPDEFLTVPVKHTIVPTHQDDVIGLE